MMMILTHNIKPARVHPNAAKTFKATVESLSLFICIGDEAVGVCSTKYTAWLTFKLSYAYSLPNISIISIGSYLLCTTVRLGVVLPEDNDDIET